MKRLKHKKKTNSVVLCCNSVKCPEVYHVSDDKIRIRDDDGFIVTMTKDQAKMISEAVDLLDEKNSD